MACAGPERDDSLLRRLTFVPSFFRLVFLFVEQYYLVPGNGCCYSFGVGSESLIHKCFLLHLTLCLYCVEALD